MVFFSPSFVSPVKMLRFTDHSFSYWEGHQVTFYFHLLMLQISFFLMRRIVSLGEYYFPVALDVHFDKNAKSPALENKRFSFFKWLILLTCSCHVHVHTQQPLQ